MAVTIQHRRDTAANWAAVNPVLHDGEIGLERDTGKAKMGDGSTAWSSLAYWSPGGSTGNVLSVNGHTGTVVLTYTDVSADASGAAAAAQAASLQKASNLSDVASRQAALNTLTGTQAAGRYLRSDGINAGLSALLAADVPQLAQYNPVGLTGATTPTSYAGGTVAGHPLSGTWTQGQWVVDQQGRIFVCVAAGTPGTWRRVGAMPYQFFLDDYAKGDGTQALVTTTAGSAVISTTPLAAPAAPVPTTSATGGTVLAGVYQVVVTFVNRWGETVGSAAGSVTTTGTTSTITVPAPAPVGNATGWYAYVSQAGGAAGTATRQQAPGSPSAMGVALILTAPPTNTGAAAPASDSSAAQVFTSTAVDGGKNVMICGGLGSPGGPWIDTIATVQSPTQATLSSNGASQGGNVSQAGCAMVFSTDDRLAIDQCIADARAYALANNNFAQVIGGDKNYGLGTGLFQSSPANNTGTYTYNTQVRIPNSNSSGETEKLEIHLLGPGDGSHAEFWVSKYVNLNGCTFISYSMGPTTADATYGQQSVIGGPTGGMNFNGSSGFANVKAVIQGIQVIHPGWSNSIGIDLSWVSACRIRAGSNVFAPTTSSGGGVNPSNAWVNNSFFQSKLGIGMQLPNGGNNDDVVVESFSTEGVTTGLVTAADHVNINRLLTINENIGVKLTGGSTSHALNIRQWSFENVNGALQCTGGSGPLMVNIMMDGENSAIGNDINDPNNVLTGTIHWRDNFRAANAPTVTGGGNVRIVNDSLGPGFWSGAPAVPASAVAQKNTAWRDATIQVTGGTVSQIAIDGQTTGLTSGMFRVPSGKTITLTYSVAPTWKWWLD